MNSDIIQWCKEYSEIVAEFQEMNWYMKSWLNSLTLNWSGFSFKSLSVTGKILLIQSNHDPRHSTEIAIFCPTFEIPKTVSECFKSRRLKTWWSGGRGSSLGGTLAHLRVLISKTIEGKSIFMEGRAPRAEVRRDRSQMRNTGRFRVSDCPSGPRPARFAETVRLRGAAHTLSTHLERPKYFNELLRGSRAAGRR